MVGLGCESGAYLIYGCTATAAWSCLVLSAYLSHKYSDSSIAYNSSLSSRDATTKASSKSLSSLIATSKPSRTSLQTTQTRSTILALVIVVTRLIGKALACGNAFYLLTISLLQFTKIYHSCWCSACVLQYGAAEGWVPLWATDIQIMEVALNGWIAGVIIRVLAMLFAGCFFSFSCPVKRYSADRHSNKPVRLGYSGG